MCALGPDPTEFFNSYRTGDFRRDKDEVVGSLPEAGIRHGCCVNGINTSEYLDLLRKTMSEQVIASEKANRFIAVIPAEIP